MRPSPCYDLIVDVMETLARMIVIAQPTDRCACKKSAEQPSPRIDIRSIQS